MVRPYRTLSMEVKTKHIPKTSRKSSDVQVLTPQEVFQSSLGDIARTVSDPSTSPDVRTPEMSQKHVSPQVRVASTRRIASDATIHGANAATQPLPSRRIISMTGESPVKGLQENLESFFDSLVDLKALTNEQIEVVRASCIREDIMTVGELRMLSKGEFAHLGLSTLGSRSRFFNALHEGSDSLALSVPIERLRAITATFVGATNLEDLLKELFVIVDSVVLTGYWGMYVFDPEIQRLRWAGGRGLTEEEKNRAEATAMERHPGEVYRTGNIMHWPDVLKHSNGGSHNKRSIAIRSRLWVPIAAGGEVLGCIGMTSTIRNHFKPRHITMLCFIADLAGLVYRNLRDKKVLKTAVEAAEAASAAKDQFVANMSHEVRTPLNGVIGMAMELASTELTADQRECLRVIHTSADALVNLVNDILDVSKAMSGKMTLENGPFNLAECSKDAILLCEPLVKTKEGLTVKFVNNCDHSCFIGDMYRVRQILLNLLTNAIKFTAKGSVTLTIQKTDEQDPGVIKISVTDTGIGIDGKALERIFDKFTQADLTTTRRYGGTGLGLSISRLLATEMGGSLTAVSEVGVGSTFTARVKLGRVSSDEVVSIKKRQKQHRNVTPFENPPRVLVVEDNIINQQVAVRMLRRLNIVPVVVDNGLHAVREMKENEYDLILMDFHMPVMDGLEATRQIRKLSGIRSSIPIVAMTASAIESEKQACLNAGMDGFLSKPIYAAPLAKQLRRFSPKSQQQQVIKIPEVKSDPVLPVVLDAK